jgi:glycosyltransferase involved in cell wall biosynthesis
MERVEKGRAREVTEFAKMRVAVVSPFVDRRHGTERALCEILERLAREYPCEVHLFAQHAEGCDFRVAADRDSGATSQIIWHRVASVPGPHVVQFIAWYFRNRRARQKAVRHSGLPFDLVLSPGVNCSDADVIIVHALFHRLQELSVDSAPPAGLLRNLHRKIYYRLLTQLESKLYRNPAVALAAVSPGSQRDLARYFQREDVGVIPNAVDSAAFSPEHRLSRRAEMRRRYGFADKHFVLLLIGNDWAVKGLPAVLQTLALLPQLPLRLLVAGSDTAEPFRQMAANLGVQERCRWELPAADVLAFYAAADVYVSPSLEDSFGLPVAEAMACGLPAITSRFAGISGFVADGVNAFVLDEPRNAQALAERLSDIYANITLRQQVASAATLKAREWTWDNAAAQVWELLSTVSARKSGTLYTSAATARSSCDAANVPIEEHPAK